MELAFENEPEHAKRTRPSRLLLVSAIVPWLIMMAVIASNRLSAYDNAPITVPSEQPTPTAPALLETPPLVGQAIQPTPLVTASPPSQSPTQTMLDAYALVIVHDHLRDILSMDGPYEIAQLIVEHVDTTSVHTTIVTVLARIVTPDDSRLARYAVPLAIDTDGVITTLGAYPVDFDVVTIEIIDLNIFTLMPSVTPIYTALEAAGYSNVTVEGAATAPGWPILAAITFLQIDGPKAAIVMLHDTGSELVLAGVPNQPPRMNLSAPLAGTAPR